MFRDLFQRTQRVRNVWELLALHYFANTDQYLVTLAMIHQLSFFYCTAQKINLSSI